MPTPTPEQVVTLYHRQLLRLRDGTAARVALMWNQLGDVDNAERFATAAGDASLAGQQTAAQLMDAYLATYSAVAVGRNAAPLGIATDQVTGAAVRTGTKPTEVYTRPTITARAALANGKPWVDAMAAGRARAASNAETDIMLTQRAAFGLVTGEATGGPQSLIQGYRRTLTGASCTLCRVASTQRYTRGDLMPIHSHCDCGIAPIIGATDPGRLLNEQLHRELVDSGELDALGRQKAISGRRKRAATNRARAANVDAEALVETDPSRQGRLEQRAQSWRDRAAGQDGEAERLAALPPVAVRDHGELGPVLTDARHAFTGPAAI